MLDEANLYGGADYSDLYLEIFNSGIVSVTYEYKPVVVSVPSAIWLLFGGLSVLAYKAKKE